MTLYGFIFYVLAGLILASTGLAVTRRNLVHAVVYLVISFFGSAMLFYLLGAPLLAALEVIIYAGAIMILFIFIIMMLNVEKLEELFFPARQWRPAVGLAIGFLALGVLMFAGNPEKQASMKTAVAEPAEFGQYLFQQHWLSIEIISLLLLIVLVGVLYLGKDMKKHTKVANVEDKP